MKYEDYIERSIIANNEYGITEVHNFKDIKEIGLERGDYPKIKEIITRGEVSSLHNWPANLKGCSQFLVIMTFNDQYSNKYIVTTYDNDLLNHDPQVVDIFPWTTV